MFNFVHEVRQKIFIYFTVRRVPKKSENHWSRILLFHLKIFSSSLILVFLI
jgi:hypothetical protein